MRSNKTLPNRQKHAKNSNQERLEKLDVITDNEAQNCNFEQNDD